MFPSYAELHCLTNFSFLRGASHPEELVERAVKLGYSALAITDECSVAGAVRAHMAAKELGLELIVGAEFTLSEANGARQRKSSSAAGADSPSRRTAAASPTSASLRLVLLATDREGYGNLSELITRGRRQAKKGEYRLTRADFENGVPGCLALWLPPAQPQLAQAEWLRSRFPQTSWIAVELLCSPDDRARLEQLQQLAVDCGLPLVAAGDVHMHVRARRALQDTLTAIRHKCPIARAGDALFANGERHLRPRERLARLYPAELLIETLNVAQRCRFSLDSLRYEYPEEVVPAGETPASYLRKLAESGFQWRFGCDLRAAKPDEATPTSENRSIAASAATAQASAGSSEFPPCSATPLSSGAASARGWGDRFSSSRQVDVDKARTLVEHELTLIADLQYEPYFLTVYDIVRFARSERILCQGRGSAANSAVCYCLGITEVDPARMDMLFERFISKERNEPPDIDVDFEHERREEVIQYLYQKYGRDRAAIAATIITYRPKSAVRDVGKALGLDLAQVDRLAKTSGVVGQPARRSGASARIRLRSAQRASCNSLIDLVNLVVGFPRHLSQHVGGFVISRGPLSRLVPIENAAMPERTVIQWDKDDLDALGLLKIDVLALGMLTAIRRALDLVERVARATFRHVRRAAGRSRRIRDDQPRRHDRRVPDRVARADRRCCRACGRSASTIS